MDVFPETWSLSDLILSRNKHLQYFHSSQGCWQRLLHDNPQKLSLNILGLKKRYFIFWYSSPNSTASNHCAHYADGFFMFKYYVPSQSRCPHQSNAILIYIFIRTYHIIYPIISEVPNRTSRTFSFSWRHMATWTNFFTYHSYHIVCWGSLLTLETICLKWRIILSIHENIGHRFLGSHTIQILQYN